MADIVSFDFKSLVSKDKLKAAICKAIYSEDVEVVNFDVSKGTDEVEGFLSIILRVKVDFIYNGDRFSKMVLVKRMPIVPMQLDLARSFNAYEKEVQVFTQPVEEYKVLSTNGETSLPLPKCYYTEIDGTNDTIIMEDLKDSGFKLVDKVKGLDLDHCLLVMKSLGKYHALSVILEQKLNSPLIDWYPFLSETVIKIPQDPSLTSYLNSILNGVIKCMQPLPEYQSVIPGLRKRFDGLWDEVCELVKPSKDTINVLCHGDCHVSNMMFRYENQCDQEKLVEHKFIDFQLARYATPITDIIYFLFTSTEPQLRRQSTNTILETYHRSFISTFSEMGVSAPSFSLVDLLKTYEERKPLGVLMSCWIRLPCYYGDFEKMPKDYNEVDPEVLEGLLKADFCEKYRNAFSVSETFRHQCISVVDETLELFGLR